MRTATRLILSLICAAIAVMWVYALGFASKEAVNKIGDIEWTQRAEVRCKQAELQRIELADYRLITEPGTGGLSERANLVDRATDTLVEMLADLQADMPSDEKGRALIPLWIADYNSYIDDRRAYSAQLRTQSNAPFAESTYEGLPLAERIATFAGDNRMPSCSPPIDLSV